MKNLVYVVLNRGVNLISYDFEESIRKAFSIGGELAIWSFDENELIVSVTCDEYNFCDVEWELVSTGLFDVIPDGESKFKLLRSEYIQIQKERDFRNMKVIEQREYDVYLKVKERLGL